jgi:hypothetical protein
MLIIEIVCPIILMSILGRMSGGGIVSLPRSLSRLPELLFAGGISVGVYALHASLPLALLALVWSFFWMETGHGTAYSMGRKPALALSLRKQFLSRIVDPICLRLRAPLGGSFYCWLFMGLKGFLIGLPAFPFGLLLAVAWPAGYELGWRLKGKTRLIPTEIGEYATAAAAGVVVSLCLIFS